MGSPTCISLPMTNISHHHHSSHQHQSQTSRRPARNHSSHRLSPPRASTAAATVVTRPELNRSATSTSAPRASALLSKVVSAPGSRWGSPPASIMNTPMNEKQEIRFHEESRDVESGEVSPHWEEALRYWNSREQRDGYVSFPDFENFIQEEEQVYDNRVQQQASRT